MTAELPRIEHTRQLGRFFQRPIDGRQDWQFFDPKDRTWRYVQRSHEDAGSSLVFRDGWVVRKLGRREDEHDYYLCEKGALTPLPRPGADIVAHETAPGYAHLRCTERDNRLYVHTRPIYLPTPHYAALKKIAEHVDETDGVMVFASQRRSQVEGILQLARITLLDAQDFVPPPSRLSTEEKKSYRSLLRMVSEVFTLAYSDYLKREDRIEEFILDVAHRRIQVIPSPELREKLATILTLVDQNNRLAKTLHDFVVDKLPVYFDWYALGRNYKIDGVIVDGTPLEFEGRWSTNYFKLIVPNLETCLFWQTTLAPTKRGTGHAHGLVSRLLGVEVAKWRVYPYLGKLKQTGGREDVLFAPREPSQLRRALETIVGIPSFESMLREHAYIDGYNLDYRQWRGGYNFTRNFYAVVRIEEALDLGSALPTTIVCDIFGNHFAIRWQLGNYLHEADTIHSFRRGGWISLLLENVLNEIDPDYSLPAFRTLEYIGPRFAKKADAYEQGLLGLIRYCGFISKPGLDYLKQVAADPPELGRALESLIREGRIIEKGGFYFYVHNCITGREAELLAELQLDAKKSPPRGMLEARWYSVWSLLRALFPYIHPLIWGKSLFNAPLREPYPPDAERYERLRAFVKGEVETHRELRDRVRQARLSFLAGTHKGQLEFFDTLVGRKETERYIEQASLMIRNFGYAIVKARGRWIQKAHAVSQAVTQRHAYAAPWVRRIDVAERDDRGRVVPSVEFEIQTFGTGEED